MEIELKEVRDFIAGHAPFNSLAADVLDTLPRQVTTRYLRRGSTFPPADIEEDTLFIIRSGAIELRDEKDNLIGKLAETSVYGEMCRQQKAGKIIGHASEDTLLYTMPCTTIKSLCSLSEQFRNYFSSTIQQRLQQAVTLAQGPIQSYSAMTLEVNKLTVRRPVTVQVDTTIRKAARVMSAENVSSILIMENETLAGIVTDQDIRVRCVAGEIDTTRPISDIMTAKPITIESWTPLSNALLIMTRNQIHHLPILSNGTPTGNLSLSDVVRHLSTNPALIASDIDKANSIDALKKISRRMPELQLQLTNANITGSHLGEVMSTITDSLCQRLLKLAEAELGPPPAPYAWMSAGSQARNEQTSHSDQDNALIIDDSASDEDMLYFEKLARFVSDGLNTCGYVYCPGDAMATNPQWRLRLGEWKRTFEKWIERPEKKALMLSSIFFDMRPVFGNKELFTALQQHILQKTRASGIFIAYMAANALSHKPPLGFFRNFVLVHDGKHDNTLDIKHRGLAPIVDIARIYALNLGIAAVNTNERLAQAMEQGSLSREMGANLMDAFEFISSLRIRNQAGQIRKGEPVDNYLPPSMLSGLERDHLKDAFSVISDMQNVLENRYQSSRLQ